MHWDCPKSRVVVLWPFLPVILVTTVKRKLLTKFPIPIVLENIAVPMLCILSGAWLKKNSNFPTSTKESAIPISKNWGSMIKIVRGLLLSRFPEACVFSQLWSVGFQLWRPLQSLERGWPAQYPSFVGFLFLWDCLWILWKSLLGFCHRVSWIAALTWWRMLGLPVNIVKIPTRILS